MPQDMPPVGGYEPVQYKRNLPARGFRPAAYLAIMGGIMTYGFWRIGQGIREHKYATPIPEFVPLPRATHARTQWTKDDGIRGCGGNWWICG